MSIGGGATTVAFVYARDLDRNLVFYQEKLGLTLFGRDPFGAFLKGDGALVRMTPMPDFEPSQHPVLGWDVADIAATVAALRDKGVAFTIYDGMGQDADGIWTSPDGKARIAWFTDAEGNVLSLSQTGAR